MKTYKETAKRNEDILNKLLPDWSKYYEIKMRIIDPKTKIIQLSKDNKSFNYWLGTGAYYDNQKFKSGKMKVELLFSLFYS